jgi:transducin (beta)-like 1
MRDESKHDHLYDQDGLMAKNKGLSAHGALHSRPCTYLKDSGSKIKILESKSDKTLKVSWNPTNHTLAFGGDNEWAYLWDLDDNIENAQLINTLPHITPDPAMSSSNHMNTMITAIDWKPDGSMFVTAASDGIWRLWDSKGEAQAVMYNENAMPLKNKDTIASNGIHDSVNNHIGQADIDSIYDWSWNKDGSAIVTVSDKNNVILWNTEGKLRGSYQGHTDSVTNIDWKNNNQFATASQDGIIKIWDVQSSSAIKTFNAHDSNIKWLKWDHSGALLASGSEDWTVKIWSHKHDKPVFTLTDHKEMIHGLQWSPTGMGTGLENTEVKLASWSADGSIKIWNVIEGKLQDNLLGHNGMVMSLDYDPTYKYLVSGDDSGRIIIWSVKDGTIIKSFENKNKKWIYDTSWSHDGLMLATWYKDVSVIDIRYM